MVLRSKKVLLEKLFVIRHYLLIFYLFGMIFFLGFFLQPVVKAQSETVLAILPFPTNLYFNGDLTAGVQVYISDVESLNAFDITLLYDENIASVTSYSLGGFLVEPVCLEEINDPGYFRYSCSQIGKPPAVGSGVLINLTFTGIASGTTTVIIDDEALKLPDGNNQPISATLQHGTINVGYDTSAVNGNIFLQGQSKRAGIPVSLGIGATYSQGPFDALSTPFVGQNLVLPGVVNNDTYTLSTAQPRYLNLSSTVTVPPGTDVALPTLRLLAGDADGDNIINTADLDAIRDAFGTIGEGIAADVNFDGVVDLRDLALAGGNFGLTPAEAYGDWLP